MSFSIFHQFLQYKMKASCIKLPRSGPISYFRLTTPIHIAKLVVTAQTQWAHFLWLCISSLEFKIVSATHTIFVLQGIAKFNEITKQHNGTAGMQLLIREKHTFFSSQLLSIMPTSAVLCCHSASACSSTGLASWKSFITFACSLISSTVGSKVSPPVACNVFFKIII